MWNESLKEVDPEIFGLGEQETRRINEVFQSFRVCVRMSNHSERFSISRVSAWERG